MTVRVVTTLLALTCALPAVAQQEEEEESPFSGNVTLGYLATTGNTETSSLNGGVELAYQYARWLHEAKANAINASESSQTTAEAYDVTWRSGWDITDKDSLFGRLVWRKDRFGAFDEQFSQTLGYSRRVLTGDKHKLRADVGGGARQSTDQVGVDSDEVILTGGLDYRWQFSETALFRQQLVIEAGEDNTFTESITSITAQLIGALNLTASYTYRNNSEAPAGTNNTDTRTAIALEYGF
jgi:putative salt-induced outer membrane protein